MDVILTHFNLLWCPLFITCPTFHGLQRASQTSLKLFGG